MIINNINNRLRFGKLLTKRQIAIIKTLPCDRLDYYGDKLLKTSSCNDKQSSNKRDNVISECIKEAIKILRINKK